VVHGTVPALQPSDGLVRVEKDDEPVPELPGGLERGDVTGVQDVEATSGGDYGVDGGLAAIVWLRRCGL